MEHFFSQFPLRINPVSSVAYALILAYLPQFYKRGFVVSKLLKSGHTYTIAQSRIATTQATDNSKEGLYIATLTGCHLNGLEAFGYYSAAVAFACIMKVPNNVISGAAGLFITSRILYISVYLSPLNGFPRTVCWFVGIATSLALFFISSNYYTAAL